MLIEIEKLGREVGLRVEISKFSFIYNELKMRKIFRGKYGNVLEGGREGERRREKLVLEMKI